LNKYKGLDEYEDLEQEAFLALVKAVKYFDLTTEYKFTTFYPVVLQHHISQYLQQTRFVQVPRAINALKIKCNRAYNELSQLFKREPTQVEIANYIGCDVKELDQLAGAETAVRLDEVRGADDEGCTLMDTLKSDFDLENNAIDNLYQDEQKTQLWAILEAYLNNRENEIISEHYRQNKTFEQIAERQGITPQRASQIEQNTLQKLKRNPKIKRLANELEIADSMLFRGSCGTFKRKQTSVVEQIALKVDAALQYTYKTREDF
jgi:RNA polymerase sigma factor (sigma-70 family)